MAPMRAPGRFPTPPSSSSHASLGWSGSAASSAHTSSLLPTSLSRSLRRFTFDASSTPLASAWAPFLAVTLYLVAIWTIKNKIASRGKPLDLKKVVIVYNFALSAASGVLFYLVVEELWVVFGRHSFFTLFCDPSDPPSHPPVHSARGKLIFYYYLNYLFKYVELADTMLLCLRGKKTPFIHVYHHAITLVLCWTQLTVQTCMQWVIISINLGVHVLLYAYYALYEMKIDLWWKKYLTTLQIIQFLIGVAASVGAMGTRLVWMSTPTSWGWGGPCHGSWSGSNFGLAVIISYLYLFTQLYREKYEKDQADAKAIKGRMAAGQAVQENSAIPGSFDNRYVPTPTSTPKAASTSSATYISPRRTLGLSCQEDLYTSMLNDWLRHPLVVADRSRWREAMRIMEQEEEEERQRKEREKEEGGEEEEQPKFRPAPGYEQPPVLTRRNKGSNEGDLL